MKTTLVDVDTSGSKVTDLTAEVGGFCQDKEDGLVNVFATGSTVAVTTMEYEPGGVQDLQELRRDWRDRYRQQLAMDCPSPLGIDLRLLIAEVAPTLRAFSPRLGFNYSVLVRDLQRIDRDEPVRWFHVERILSSLGVTSDSERWREIHALWYTAEERRRRTSAQNHRAALERQRAAL